MKILLAALLPLLLGAASTQPASQTTSKSTSRPASRLADGWKLVWSDEFDQAGAVDSKKWTFERGFVRNNEAQYYTDRPENVRVVDGLLIIEARKEQIAIDGKAGEKSQYTSASIETHRKFDFTYGRIECRAKLPRGRGTWPAIWMLGSGIDQIGWPACGEIDIMESVGFEPNKLHGSVHTKAYNHVSHTEKTAVTSVPEMSAKFHVYAAEWTAERIDLLVDGRRYFRFANEHKSADQWPFDKPAFIKLNFAIGGAWGGQKGIDDAIFPQRFEVDYVRVYDHDDAVSGR